MKILLLGKDGQVGWELQRALAPLGDVVAFGHGDGDLREPEALAAAVRTVAPQWIVNAAAYTGVDRAETEAELATLVNATAVGALARTVAATASGARRSPSLRPSATTSPSGASARCSSQPTWPLGPSSKIFMRCTAG